MKRGKQKDEKPRISRGQDLAREAPLGQRDAELTIGNAAYTPVSLVFLLRLVPRPGRSQETQVLLGRKKRGFGRGKYVGTGGHVKPGETFLQAGIREVREEITVTPTGLRCMGWIDFVFPALPERNMTSALYTCRAWEGTIAETEELAPEWFGITQLPYNEMWDDSRFWLLRIVAGEAIRATVTVSSDLERIEAMEIASLRNSAA